jgi:hypothetical protein
LVADSVGACDRVISHTRQVLRVLQEKGSFAPGAEVCVIVTKWDQVERVDGAVTRWEGLEDGVSTDLSNLGRGSRIIRLAARPVSVRPVDDGMDSLLRWIVEDALVSETSSNVEKSPPLRSMGRFGSVTSG